MGLLNILCGLLAVHLLCLQAAPSGVSTVLASKSVDLAVQARWSALAGTLCAACGGKLWLAGGFAAIMSVLAGGECNVPEHLAGLGLGFECVEIARMSVCK